MLKYQKWLNKNTSSLEGKLALVVGATGSIGKAIVEYLLYLKAEVIIAARNLNKANSLKDEFLKKYPTSKIHTLELDISSLDSIDNFQLAIDKDFNKLDIFINNAGVYHLPKTFSKDGYEIHFATNTLGNYYLAKKIIYNLKNDCKMILTGSISYNFFKIDFNDITSMNTKNKMKVYGLSKRVMMMNAIYLKKELSMYSNISLNITHPGICATNLFNAGHSKAFLKLVVPLMKVVFHNPYKAALSTIKACFVKTNINEWIGPRGLFKVWGYPKVYNLNKRVYDNEIISNINEITEKVLKKEN